jgi:hypothetical protein
MILMMATTMFTAMSIIFGIYLYNTAWYDTGFLKLRMSLAVVVIWIGLMAWVILLMGLFHSIVSTGSQNII